MPAKQYTEYKKEISGVWTEQHPGTDTEQISGITEVSDFQLESGFTKNINDANTIILNHLGEWCYLAFSIHGLVPAGWQKTKVLTIPSKYRPKKNILSAGYSATSLLHIRIETDGSVYVFAEKAIPDPSVNIVYYL